MANQFWSVNTDTPQCVFVANTSGPIARTDNGALIHRGLVLLNSTAALALTLDAPKAGSPSLGGEDGVRLDIVVVASAPLTAPVTHTISFPTGSINGGVASTLSFAGQTNVTASLIAFNGYWWLIDSGAVMS